MNASLIIKPFSGPQESQTVWQAMKTLTDQRQRNQEPDQLWLLELEPVFTQGLAGKAEHVLNPGDIPVVKTDRGGQVTYHGPGQLVGYFLADLHRLNIGVRQLVMKIEQSMIDLMAQFNIIAHGRRDAPGVYVDDKKLCSIGLRVSRGFSYHGFALNVDLDLEPFSRINPCGYQGLAMTRITDYAPDETVSSVSKKLAPIFTNVLGYQNYSVQIP